MKGRLYGASVFLQVQEYTNVQRWTDAIAKRPAARRRAQGQPHLGRALGSASRRHDASDFKTKTHDKVGDSGTASGG